MFGDQSTQSLKTALAKLNVEGGVAGPAKPEAIDENDRRDTARSVERALLQPAIST